MCIRDSFYVYEDDLSFVDLSLIDRHCPQSPNLKSMDPGLLYVYNTLFAMECQEAKYRKDSS